MLLAGQRHTPICPKHLCRSIGATCYHKRSRLWRAAAFGVTLLHLSVAAAGHIRAQEMKWIPTSPSDQGTPPVLTLNLEECIAYARDNQPLIQARIAASGAAREKVNVAHSHFLPQVGFQFRYTLNDEVTSVDSPSPITGQAADVFGDAAAFFGIAEAAGSAAALAALNNPNNPPFSTIKQAAIDALPPSIRTDLLGRNFVTTELLAVQPLWTGGKIYFRFEQAKLGAQAAQLEVYEAQQQIALEVSRAYYAAVLAGELAQVAENAAGSFRVVESIASVFRERRLSRVEASDITRPQSLKLLFEAEAEGLLVARKRALAGIKYAMGIPQHFDFQIADDNLTVQGNVHQLDELVRIAQMQRPEVAKARVGVAVADAQKQIAMAEYRPNVWAFGRFATIQDDRNFLNPNDPQQWSVGVALAVPVFQGFRRPASNREAAWDQVRSQRLLSLQDQQVTEQVYQAYYEFQEAAAQIKPVSEAVTAAKKTFDDIVDRAIPQDRVETANYFLERVLAIQLRAAAEVKYNRTLYDQNLALAKLRWATSSEVENEILQSSRSVGRDSRHRDAPGGRDGR